MRITVSAFALRIVEIYAVEETEGISGSRAMQRASASHEREPGSSSFLGPVVTAPSFRVIP